MSQPALAFFNFYPFIDAILVSVDVMRCPHVSSKVIGPTENVIALGVAQRMSTLCSIDLEKELLQVRIRALEGFQSV